MGTTKFISLLVVALGAIEGATHLVATFIDAPTLRSLLVAVVTAVITGVFGVSIARIQTQADRRQHKRLDELEHRLNDVAGAVGANKRDTDPPEE
jgi:ABC-type Fe3+ transport system permease subunit